ncbi:penicillin-binding protein 2 [Candidatus Saccharibacteria bacterium]|nr:penicillin-binding protein 2 [Candidatus Saccharibacteria bacterium]
MSRIKLLRYGLLIAVGIIAVRLFVIQIFQHDEWVARAEAEHTSQNTIIAKRGEIYMMEGDEPVPVVLNKAGWMVIVDPKVANEEKTERAISEIAGDKVVAKWEDVFKDKTRRYYVVARNVEREQVKKLKEKKLAGVYYQEGNSRVYPEGEMASGLLGFVNAEGKGQYGVEGSLNDQLGGKNGLLKTITDVNNVALSIGDDNVRIPAEDGKNVVLTIDRTLQRKVEKKLAEYLSTSKANHASAVVMDPRNGKVLTMATIPNYEPEKYAEVKDGNLFLNQIVDVAYEPASICKTFTFAAAVEEGVMTPETTYNNTGEITVDGWPIKNAHSGQLGVISMQTALNYSLNTGSMTALMLLGGSKSEITKTGREKLFDYYYNHFGLGQATGFELSESTGLIQEPNKGYGLNSRYANMTFGQNINLTPLQVAAAFSSLINGGEYYAPTIIAGEMKDGKFVKAEEKKSVRRTVTEKTSETMRAMIWGTRGLQRLYGIDKPGYYIGGKTGTAQGIKDGAYTFDETTGSYVGFGGRDGELPEYVIMVKIWEGGQTLEGTADALPLFNLLSDTVIDHLKIKPKEQ